MVTELKEQNRKLKINQLEENERLSNPNTELNADFEIKPSSLVPGELCNNRRFERCAYAKVQKVFRSKNTAGWRPHRYHRYRR